MLSRTAVGDACTRIPKTRKKAKATTPRDILMLEHIAAIVLMIHRRQVELAQQVALGRVGHAKRVAVHKTIGVVILYHFFLQ